jgi:light-harvesting complex II chlorophyll a/b binding protein 4
MQVGIDQLDQNKAVNKAGAIVGKFAAPKSKISDTALQPYDEVFGLQRFRETELIHGRSVNFELMMDRCILLLSCTVKRQY